MNRKSARFRAVDVLLIAMMILPLVAGMALKILTTPASEGIEISGARIYFTIPMPVQDLPITESQVNSWLVMISILGLCLYLVHGITVKPGSKRQLAAEWIVEKTNGLVRENMGKRFMGFAPFVAGIMALSAFSSLMSLVGLRPPTSDMNVVAGWAILVFVLITHYKLKGGLASVDGTIDTANKLLAESDDLTNAESQAKVKKLSAAVKSLQSLSANAVQISTAVNSGVNTEEALKDLDLNAIFAASADAAKVQQLIASQSAKMAKRSQIPALIEGVGNYTAGVSKTLAGSNKLVAKNNDLNAGATKLKNGVDGLGAKIPELTQGITALYNGTQKLKNNSAALNSGASKINAGLGQLNGKVPALAGGVNQLASGTSQLAANSGALRLGAGQLASGLGQLNSQVPTLTDGVSQLAAGTSKLSANSGKLDKGATDVHKGNKKLASALKGGADTVTKLKLGSANASMFASPTKLKEKHYSYVPNYGYALAPYMLSVALFVGCLVFNLVYPIRRISTEDGSATEWFFSKVAIGALVATGNALVETVLMMVCGLHPDHPVQMIVNAVSFSFTSMFLIMFMAMAFGNPGRFISMILLVIQLGSCGGSFPIEITRGMNGFFQAINPYLPMTYSVYGFREALTSGLGANQVLHSVLIQLIFIAAFLILLYVTMRVIRPEQEFHEEMESEYPGN